MSSSDVSQPEKMNLESMSISDHQKAKLKELFPEVFTEGLKVDFDQLKRTLGEMVDGGKERFGMQWAGKADCFKTIQQPSLATLVPCPEEGIEFDTTENVFIEGDNLEVLKLLQKSYLGKVKMIYIDPPYNTGNDFVYPDNYSENLDTYLEYTGQVDGSGRKFGTNVDTDGRFHSKWMNMMYPRLFLAKNLLREDGVIFISIDDNEIHNLRLLCNEIFGVENFINSLSIKMKNIAGASGGGEDKRLRKNLEYLLFYSKEYNSLNVLNNIYTFTPVGDLVKKYRENNVSWKYTSVLVNEGEKIYIGSTVDGNGDEIKLFRRDGFEIRSINSIIFDENISEIDAYNKYGDRIFEAKDAQSSIRSRVIDEKLRLEINSELISIEYTPKTGKNKNTIYEQFYKGDKCRLFAWLKDVSVYIDGNLCKKDIQGTYWDLTGSVNNLTKEGEVSFSNGKKPIKLIQQMLKMVTHKDDIVLDFFAGSATTAHAVMDLNKEDGGNRKYICVQLPEPTEEQSEAHKQGYKTIAEISKERIRRASAKIKAEAAEQTDLLTEDKAPLDLGFRVFKLQKSNFSVWDSTHTTDPEQITLQLEQHIDHIAPEASQQAILFELLLKSGYELTTSIETLTLANKTVYSIADNALLICLEKELTIEVMNAIAALEPSRVIVLDEGFQNNDQLKTNSTLTLKAKGVHEFRTV